MTKKNIQEKSTYYKVKQEAKIFSNILFILSKVEKDGFFSVMEHSISQIIEQEFVYAVNELKKIFRLNPKFDIKGQLINNTYIYKENLKLLSNILIDSLWKEKCREENVSNIIANANLLKNWKNRVDEIKEEDENTNNTNNSKDEISDREKTLEMVNSQSKLNKLENDEDLECNPDYQPKDDEVQEREQTLDETEGEPLELEGPENNPMGTYICDLNNVHDQFDSNNYGASESKMNDKDLNVQYEDIVDKIKALEMLDPEESPKDQNLSKEIKENKSNKKSLEINDHSENYVEHKSTEAYIELWDKPTMELLVKQKDDKVQKNNLIHIPKSESNYITDIESNSFIKKTFKKFHKIKTEGDDIDREYDENSDGSEEIDNTEIATNMIEKEVPYSNILNKSADIVLNKKLEIALIAGSNMAFPSHRQAQLNQNQVIDDSLKNQNLGVLSIEGPEVSKPKVPDPSSLDKSAKYRHFTNYKSSQQDNFSPFKEYKSLDNKYITNFESDRDLNNSEEFCNSTSHRNRLTNNTNSGDYDQDYNYDSASSKISDNIRTNNLHSMMSFDRQMQQQYKMLHINTSNRENYIKKEKDYDKNYILNIGHQQISPKSLNNKKFINNNLSTANDKNINIGYINKKYNQNNLKKVEELQKSLRKVYKIDNLNNNKNKKVSLKKILKAHEVSNSNSLGNHYQSPSKPNKVLNISDRLNNKGCSSIISHMTVNNSTNYNNNSSSHLVSNNDRQKYTNNNLNISNNFFGTKEMTPRCVKDKFQLNNSINKDATLTTRAVLSKKFPSSTPIKTKSTSNSMNNQISKNIGRK